MIKIERIKRKSQGTRMENKITNILGILLKNNEINLVKNILDYNRCSYCDYLQIECGCLKCEMCENILENYENFFECRGIFCKNKIFCYECSDEYSCDDCNFNSLCIECYGARECEKCSNNIDIEDIERLSSCILC